MSLKVRTVLYSVIIAIGVSKTVVGSMTAVLNGFGKYTTSFGIASTVLATVTWIWMSVLLSYNNRPTVNNLLTRASTHVITLAVLSVIWLALAIMLASQASQECQLDIYSDGSAYVWCPLAASSTGLAFILWGLLTSTASVVFIAVSGSGKAGLSANVAQYDGGSAKSIP